jgi:hypothetical protein
MVTAEAAERTFTDFACGKGHQQHRVCSRIVLARVSKENDETFVGELGNSTLYGWTEPSLTG